MRRGSRTRCAPLPLVGRGWGWGSLLVDATRRNNYHPHPDRLRFASAVDPPHKGEGKLGLEPSCKTTECLASRRFHFIGISSYSRARSVAPTRALARSCRRRYPRTQRSAPSVALPPGRLRLSTVPSSTGSEPVSSSPLRNPITGIAGCCERRAARQPRRAGPFEPSGRPVRRRMHKSPTICSRPFTLACLLLLEPSRHDAKLYAPPRVSAAL